MHDKPEPRRRATDALIVVSLIACFAMIFAPRFQKTYAFWNMRGQQAPELSLFDVDSGENVRLDGLRGKVVVLDFWATWCPPCRKQMPAVEALSRDASLGDKVAVLSINTDKPAPDRQANVRAFMKMNKYQMKTVLDDGSASRAYNVDSIPTLVILGPDGRVHHIDSGVHSEQKLRSLIQDASAPMR